MFKKVGLVTDYLFLVLILGSVFEPEHGVVIFLRTSGDFQKKGHGVIFQKI
jgi:hypothetical protein